MKRNIWVWTGALALASLSAASLPARADVAGDAEKSADVQKDVAKDQEKVAEKLADIKAQQAKIDQHVAQYGVDSDQVKKDNEKLKDLQKDLADLRNTQTKDAINGAS